MRWLSFVEKLTRFFVVSSEVACQAVALCEGLEESLIIKIVIPLWRETPLEMTAMDLVLKRARWLLQELQAGSWIDEDPALN